MAGMFSDTLQAAAITGLSVKQFLRAAKRLSIQPREFGINKRHFWLTSVLLENKDALIAETGRGKGPRSSGVRLPVGHVCK